MTRRELLQAATGIAVAFPGGAQVSSSRVSYRTYSRCLPDYLRSLAEQAYQRRNAIIARLTTPTRIQERQPLLSG